METPISVLSKAQLEKPAFCSLCITTGKPLAIPNFGMASEKYGLQKKTYGKHLDLMINMEHMEHMEHLQKKSYMIHLLHLG